MMYILHCWLSHILCPFDCCKKTRALLLSLCVFWRFFIPILFRAINFLSYLYCVFHLIQRVITHYYMRFCNKSLYKRKLIVNFVIFSTKEVLEPCYFRIFRQKIFIWAVYQHVKILSTEERPRILALLLSTILRLWETSSMSMWRRPQLLTGSQRFSAAKS